MLEKILKIFEPRAAKIEKRYVQIGGDVGDVLSMVYMGKCVGFDKMVEKWAQLEHQYADLGFRTVSLDDFIEYGGYGKDIKPLLGKKRDEGEAPIYHAQRFKEIENVVFEQPDVGLPQKVFDSGEPMVGNYFLPSTKRDDDP